jgi:hypothetical protein
MPVDNFGNLTDVDLILHRYSLLLAVQMVWLPEWQECADYVIPRKNSIAVQRIPGYKRTQRMFDSTAPHAMELLSAALHGTLTPSFIPWFRITPSDTDLAKDYNVRNWLDMVNGRLRDELRSRSNFNSEVHEMYIDLTAFGTSCFFMEEKQNNGWWGGFNFVEVPIGKYCVAEGADGKVDTVYRSFVMSAHAIQEKWPGKLPEELSGKPDELHEVIHAVVPEMRYEKGNQASKRWKSDYILYKTHTRLSSGKFNNFPFMVSRWTKYSDETYGRGPTHVALPDVRSLNKIIEMELRNIAKNVDPPLRAIQGEVFGNARMIPGGVTTVARPESLSPIDTTGNFQVTNLKKEELKQSINNMYFIDQLQLQTGPQMTATEVNVRYDTMQRNLGPMLGRVESEFARPMITRGFQLMLEAGLFHPLPQALLAAGRNKPIDLLIQYKGPLALAQRSSDITALQQFEESFDASLKADPQVADNIDWDELIRYKADLYNIPISLLKDKEQVAQQRQAKEQIMQEQRGLEQATQATQAAKNVAPVMRQLQQRADPGSALDKVG